MAPQDVIGRMAPIFTEINRRIEAQMDSAVEYVNEVSGHILRSGGKRVRPALFILGAHICGRKDGSEYDLATSVEFLHAATLLHDDVVDESDLRRGRQAAHRVYGNQTVILVGDFLLARSLAVGVNAGRLDFISIMSRTVSLMAEGEVMQLIHARDPEITEETYEEIIYRKTGALIETSCELGALLADAPAEQVRAMKEYGRAVGFAFQIVDDCLDFTGSASEFGKPVGHDLDEGKITLPVIRALRRAEGPDRTRLAELVSQPERSPENMHRILELIEQYDGLGQAAARAADLAESAKHSLSVLPPCEERDLLEDLADFIVRRRK